MAISVQSKSVGLCLTCDNSPFCAYRQMRGFDAMFCEMFHNNGDAPHAEHRAPNPGPARPASGDPEAETLIGLCSNCEHRRECTFPKPEGGVWHCEEYR